jgi:hypothetical protein
VLSLRLGARVVVTVADGAGRPVAGVPIGHRLPSRAADRGRERFAAAVLTDARGAARFPDLEAGVHAFRVEQEDGESSWWSDDEDAAVREQPWQELVVGASGETVIALVAPPRGSLAGYVSAAGRPLEGAVVKLVPWVEGRKSGWTWSGGGPDPFSARTDHRGEYRLENRRVGSYLALLHHPDRRMPAELRVELGPGENVQDFVLDVNEIHGRITDPEGRPLRDVVVNVTRAEEGLEMDPPPILLLSTDDRGEAQVESRTPRGSREARTDAQGTYALRGLAANTLLVLATEGDDFEKKRTEPLKLAPGEVRHGVDFVLRRAGRLRIDLAGQLAPDRWYFVDLVRVEDGAESVAHQVWLGSWDRDQHIGSIVPGAYTLRLWLHDEHGNHTPLGETPVEIEVGRLARVTLHVP